MLRLRSFSIAVVALAVASTSALGQRPVVWSASSPSAPVPRGGVTVVHVTAHIDGGWHVYSLTQVAGGPIPAQITLAPGQPFTLADVVRGPSPIERFDRNFGIKVETYDATATFTVPVRVAANAPTGATTLTINARFQTCNDTLCLPPHTEKLTVPVTVGTLRTATTSTGR